MVSSVNTTAVDLRLIPVVQEFWHINCNIIDSLAMPSSFRVGLSNGTKTDRRCPNSWAFSFPTYCVLGWQHFKICAGGTSEKNNYFYRKKSSHRIVISTNLGYHPKLYGLHIVSQVNAYLLDCRIRSLREEISSLHRMVCTKLSLSSHCLILCKLSQVLDWRASFDFALDQYACRRSNLCRRFPRWETYSNALSEN